MSQLWPAISSATNVLIDDLLDRLNSIRSNWSGTARPGTPVAGQLFFDTDSGPIFEVCTNATGPVWAGLATVLDATELLTKIKTVDGTGSGLDADTLDGHDTSYFQVALGYTPLNSTSYTAADVLAKLLTVDGTGSGLDADLLDAQSGAYYLACANFTGTLAAGQFPALTGDVTSVAGALATTIANNAVTNGKFRQGVAKSVVGVAGSATANVADITGTANQFLQVNSTANGLAFVSLSGDATLADGVITLGASAVNGKTADAAPDMAADYALTYDASASALKKVLLQYIGAGKQAFWIGAGSMVKRASNPCADLATLETTTNKQNYDYLAFDPTTQEFCCFDWRAPKAIATNTFTFVFVWSHPSTTTNFGVVWGISGAGRGDADAMEIANGTAVTATDTGGTTDTIYVSPVTAACTLGGTFAAEDYLKFQISRNPADGADTMAVDARLHGVWVIVNNNRNTEA